MPLLTELAFSEASLNSCSDGEALREEDPVRPEATSSYRDMACEMSRVGTDRYSGTTIVVPHIAHCSIVSDNLSGHPDDANLTSCNLAQLQLSLWERKSDKEDIWHCQVNYRPPALASCFSV